MSHVGHEYIKTVRDTLRSLGTEECTHPKYKSVLLTPVPLVGFILQGYVERPQEACYDEPHLGIGKLHPDAAVTSHAEWVE